MVAPTATWGRHGRMRLSLITAFKKAAQCVFFGPVEILASSSSIGEGRTSPRTEPSAKARSPGIRRPYESEPSLPRCGGSVPYRVVARFDTERVASNRFQELSSAW